MKTDVFDIENATAIIYEDNLDSYLEKYGCNSIQELEDEMWYNMGVFLIIRK